MSSTTVLLLLLAIPAQPPADKDQAAKAQHERALEIYRADAADYAIYRDSSRKERVELKREPVYVWTNAVRGSGQDGAVFVWTCRGRAEVVGCFFSYPLIGPRKLHHEFHSLATTVLDVAREGEHAHNWHPEAPGIDFVPVLDAPAPAKTAQQRLVQMRGISREFTAKSRDKMGNPWELRLLPQPLYRGESTDPDVLDGALFSFVTSAGTDPEVMLVVEARRPSSGGDFTWQYALGRFSDLELWVSHKGKPVFHVPDVPYGTEKPDPKYRYNSYGDRQIPAIERPAP